MKICGTSAKKDVGLVRIYADFRGVDRRASLTQPLSKWGQVVGNIVSEWTQAFGLIILTKKLIERGSAESKQQP